MKHLRFDMMVANLDCKEIRHPQTVMKELGISYTHATPQSIGDQWWFWNCDGFPEKLPEYITTLDADPMDCIGYGLSKEEAEKMGMKTIRESGWEKVLEGMTTVEEVRSVTTGEEKENAHLCLPGKG